MRISLGLDVGAVSVKLAALGAPEHFPLFERLAADHPSFFIPQHPNGIADRPIVLSRYRRLQGNPMRASSDLLREFHEATGKESVSQIRVTGSGGRTVAQALGTKYENEFGALARGIRAFYPEVRTVFEMGGETSKYIRLGATNGHDHLGILDYQSSAECAAGTGSFIDQQASRLLYDVEEVGPAACGASCAARVAGRCSVFAKSDMIHAQQKGYQADQILRPVRSRSAKLQIQHRQGQAGRSPGRLCGWSGADCRSAGSAARSIPHERVGFSGPGNAVLDGGAGSQHVGGGRERQDPGNNGEPRSPGNTGIRIPQHRCPLSGGRDFAARSRVIVIAHATARNCRRLPGN